MKTKIIKNFGNKQNKIKLSTIINAIENSDFHISDCYVDFVANPPSLTPSLVLCANEKEYNKVPKLLYINDGQVCDDFKNSQKNIAKYLKDIFNTDDINQYNVLICYLREESYEGYIWLLLMDKKTKELYEVDASHCSCNGFEGQFDPILSTPKYLKSSHFSYCNNNNISEYIEKYL